MSDEQEVILVWPDYHICADLCIRKLQLWKKSVVDARLVLIELDSFDMPCLFMINYKIMK